MKIILFTFFVSFYAPAISQTINISDYNKTIYTTRFTKKSKAKAFYAEIPPWVIKDKQYHYFFTTNFTACWSSTWSLGNPINEIKELGSKKDLGPKWILTAANWWQKFYPPAVLENPLYPNNQQWQTDYWRRNYNGIFCAHIITLSNTRNKILFAVSHGENKNEKQDSYFYQNTVRPSFTINPGDATTFSGMSNGSYKDCREAYFGFLNGSWVAYDTTGKWSNEYLNDIGPIAWPSAGYVNTDNTQASTGLRHPSSIVNDNYIYIFVKDESNDGTGGIKLIRCLLDSILKPNCFETWSAIQTWVPSLPKGFSKNLCGNFFSSRGPKNTPVFPNDRNTIRFSVAKFKNTNQFIGVEQYNDEQDNNHSKLAFRFSQDLIHWSDRVNFFNNTEHNWDDMPLKYPIFLSADGTSNTEVDKDQFYVIGTSGNNSVSRLLFSSNIAHPVLSK